MQESFHDLYNGMQSVLVGGLMTLPYEVAYSVSIADVQCRVHAEVHTRPSGGIQSVLSDSIATPSSRTVAFATRLVC